MKIIFLVKTNIKFNSYLCRKASRTNNRGTMAVPNTYSNYLVLKLDGRFRGIPFSIFSKLGFMFHLFFLNVSNVT